MVKSSLSLLPLAAAAALGCSTTYKASAYTGIRTRSVTASDATFSPGMGVIVSSIDEDSEAFQKGIREADLIKAVNGKAVTTPEAFANAVLNTAEGATVTLKVANTQNKEKDVAVKKNQEKAGEKKTYFGVSFPFLLYHEGGDTSGTAVGHFNIVRFRNKAGDKGFMLLELLGYVKKPDGWAVRILFFTFGSANQKPAKGKNPDI